LAKIAVELERALAMRAAGGAPGRTASCLLARGEGWSVADVICTSGPGDHPFEERHKSVSIAIVAAGTFQYRSARGREVMTPGSLLLGNPGESFECGHDHAAGDRCLSFKYTPEHFERVAAEAGLAGRRFRLLRVPPLRRLAPLVARACAGLGAWDATPVSTEVRGDAEVPWEQLSVELAARTAELECGQSPDPAPVAPAAMARVTRALRAIERRPDDALRLGTLAQQAGLSAYHFLRTFERVTALTPHQFVLRTRLREAAIRLAQERARVVDIAFDCGFGDLSNFNRAFRTEFGVSPREYRRRTGHGG